MRIGTDRDQLIMELKAARAQVLEAVAGLSEEQMSKPELDGWSVKDHLNHLAVCDEIRFHEIGRVSRGGRPAYPPINDRNMDSLNEITVSLRRGLSTDQAMADMEFAQSLVLQAIARAPESALEEKAYGEFGLRGSADHDIAHAAAIC